MIKPKRHVSYLVIYSHKINQKDYSTNLFTWNKPKSHISVILISLHEILICMKYRKKQYSINLQFNIDEIIQKVTFQLFYNYSAN